MIGKQCLKKKFGDLWSIFLFYASFSQWLAETNFWKSARVYIYKNYTFNQPWYAQQVSRLILLWSSTAGVKFSFGQWGDDHWLKLTSEVFFGFSNKTSALFVSGNYAILMKCGVVTSVVNINHPEGQKSHFSPWQAKTPHVALMNHPLITTIYFGTDNFTTTADILPEQDYM